jgi:coenzyme F420-reducing hydrogenase gamma subunit
VSTSIPASKPKVVILSLASDFGCQVQMTNFPDLLKLLGTIDVSYWQLATTADLPDDYAIAVIEGAVTTDEHRQLLQSVRATADVVMAVGACATTGGIPALHSDGPCSVSAVIDVDFTIPGCPLDPREFSQVLQRALLGLVDRRPREPLCAACKINEVDCYFNHGQLCLGLVTRTGCGALCVSKGRPCTGCRGIAEDANLSSARAFVRDAGMDVLTFDTALELYNSLDIHSGKHGGHTMPALQSSKLVTETKLA